MRRFSRFTLGAYSFYDYHKARRQEQEQQASGQVPPSKIKSLIDILKAEERKPTEATRTEILRPEFRRRMVTLDANEYWDLDRMWNHVAETRRNPIYRGGPFIVDAVTMPNPDLRVQVGESIEFFRIPPSVYQNLSSVDEVLKTVLLPFIEQVEQSINAYKPYVVPGGIRFEMTPDGSLVLTYYDR